MIERLAQIIYGIWIEIVYVSTEEMLSYCCYITHMLRIRGISLIVMFLTVPIPCPQTVAVVRCFAQLTFIGSFLVRVAFWGAFHFSSLPD